MKGIEIKEKLRNSGFSLKQVAELMGETPQNLNSMLNAQDIKTGIVEKIAKSTNKSLYFFFDEKTVLMTEKEIKQQDEEVKNGKCQSGVSVPNHIFESESYQSLYNKYIDTLKELEASKPDVLKSKIEGISRLLEEKETRIKEKDAQIKELLKILQKSN